MWDFVSNNLLLILYSAHFSIVLAISIVMIRNHTKRDPIRTMMWIIVLYFIPVIGLLLYIFFGQNYRKSKMFNRKNIKDLKYIDRLMKQQLLMLRKSKKPEGFPEGFPESFRKIMILLLNNSKALLTEFNTVDIFYTGEETFNAMKKAMLAARNHIHMEFYIIMDDKIGNEIKEILIKKAQEGISVRVIYDDVGSWSLSKKFIRELRKAGCQVEPFLKVVFPILSSKLNYRNHRKIVVVDGKTAFMGGINIADRYIDGGKFGYWSDAHIQVEGESVRSLQAIFLVDWYFVTKEIHIRQREICFPPIDNSQFEAQNKRLLIQVITSGPDSDWAGIMQAYFAIINTAKRNIYISTPYFTPNESILTAIKTASLAGVDVRMMIPEKSDSYLVYWSTLSYVSDLLSAGVKIYLYNKGFNHSKFITVDGQLIAIGSANIDMRSFDHNFEVSAIIYDANVANEAERNFQKDIQNNSYPIHLESWETRPSYYSLREGFARLFTPLL